MLCAYASVSPSKGEGNSMKPQRAVRSLFGEIVLMKCSEVAHSKQLLNTFFLI